MPTVLFEANMFGDDCRAEAPRGGALVDVIDAAKAPVPFSCRSATCGTCRIEILEGSDLFDPPEPAEDELLAIFGDAPNFRLACQAKLRNVEGTVRLRISDTEL